jgi:hypothetical protein
MQGATILEYVKEGVLSLAEAKSFIEENNLNDTMVPDDSDDEEEAVDRAEATPQGMKLSGKMKQAVGKSMSFLNMKLTKGASRFGTALSKAGSRIKGMVDRTDRPLGPTERGFTLLKRCVEVPGPPSFFLKKRMKGWNNGQKCAFPPFFFFL